MGSYGILKEKFADEAWGNMKKRNVYSIIVGIDILQMLFVKVKWE